MLILSHVSESPPQPYEGGTINAPPTSKKTEEKGCKATLPKSHT